MNKNKLIFKSIKKRVKQSEIFNLNYSLKSNLIRIAVASILALLLYYLFSLIFDPSEIYRTDMLTVYGLISILYYFCLAVIIISFNVKKKKVLMSSIAIIICVFIIPFGFKSITMLVFLMGSLVLAFLTALFKKPLMIFTTILMYMMVGLLIGDILLSNSYVLEFLTPHEYILVYVMFIIPMVAYYATGVRLCNFIIKKLFIGYIGDKENHQLPIDEKMTSNSLKNYIYLLYFICYLSFYSYIFWTNSNISKEMEITINAVLITVIAFYQIGWDEIWEDLKKGFHDIKI